MIKEFLETLYKMCSSEHADHNAIDEIMDVFGHLSSEKRFDTINQILIEMNLDSVTTSAIYCTFTMIGNLINVLPEYGNFYQRARESYARRGKSESEINDLLDRWKDGGSRLYDPNKPPYIPPHVKDEQKLNDKIKWAESIGDQDLVNYLTWYKADRNLNKEREAKFRELKISLGEQELRKRTIQSLRGIADILENSSGSWPGIYYCTLSEWADSVIKKRSVMDGVTVVLSYPWGG